MKLNLLQDLLLVEAKIEKPEAEKVKVDKGAELALSPEKAASKEALPADDKSLSPDKTAFFFKTRFDCHGMLEQTEDMTKQREAKRVYALLGREHERGAVYGITGSGVKQAAGDKGSTEFRRAAKMLGISTDGEVTLERVKRAGFVLAGRVGAKRLMKRGDFVVSLVGPSDDQQPVTFYTTKPESKMLESAEVLMVKRQIKLITERAIKHKTPIAEAKREILDLLVAHEGEEKDHLILGEANRDAVKALRDLHPHSEFLKEGSEEDELEKQINDLVDDAIANRRNLADVKAQIFDLAVKHNVSIGYKAHKNAMKKLITDHPDSPKFQGH